VGCREEYPKRQLVRIVRSPTGAVAVDETGKAAGRGAYLCRRLECWTVALRRSTLAGALRTALSPEDVAALREFAASLTPAEALTTDPS